MRSRCLSDRLAPGSTLYVAELGSLLELDVAGLAVLMSGSDVVVFSAGADGFEEHYNRSILGR